MTARCSCRLFGGCILYLVKNSGLHYGQCSGTCGSNQFHTNCPGTSWQAETTAPHPHQTRPGCVWSGRPLPLLHRRPFLSSALGLICGLAAQLLRKPFHGNGMQMPNACAFEGVCSSIGGHSQIRITQFILAKTRVRTRHVPNPWPTTHAYNFPGRGQAVAGPRTWAPWPGAVCPAESSVTMETGGPWQHVATGHSECHKHNHGLNACHFNRLTFELKQPRVAVSSSHIGQGGSGILQ